MFGFLIKGEVNDDAVKLNTLADMAFRKYGNLEHSEFTQTVRRDLPAESYSISRNFVGLVYSELPDFEFHFDTDPHMRFLTIHGKGRYAGYLLSISDDHRHSSVNDGIVYRATAGAKKLAQLMEKKFGIQDMTKLLSEFR